MQKKEDMVFSLKELFVPALRERGFKGSLPHFRRPAKDRIDLLTIQFDKWAGGFVIEISNCALHGIVTPWGKRVPPSRVKAWDVDPPKRRRLGSPKPGEDGHWFRFDGLTGTDKVAVQAVSHLSEADKWWEAAARWWKEASNH
jgi:hypothetical protein